MCGCQLSSRGIARLCDIQCLERRYTWLKGVFTIDPLHIYRLQLGFKYTVEYVHRRPDIFAIAFHIILWFCKINLNYMKWPVPLSPICTAVPCIEMVAHIFHNHIMFLNDQLVNIALQWRHNGAMMSQITSLMIVYSTVYLGADHRRHQSSASLAFVWGIHRWQANSPHKKYSYAENVSIWWRHHGKSTLTHLNLGSMSLTILFNPKWNLMHISPSSHCNCNWVIDTIFRAWKDNFAVVIFAKHCWEMMTMKFRICFVNENCWWNRPLNKMTQTTFQIHLLKNLWFNTNIFDMLLSIRKRYMKQCWLLSNIIQRIHGKPCKDLMSRRRYDVEALSASLAQFQGNPPVSFGLPTPVTDEFSPESANNDRLAFCCVVGLDMLYEPTIDLSVIWDAVMLL